MKKETLEDVAENAFNDFKRENPIVPQKHILPYKLGYIAGAKWQQEQDNKELAMWKLAVEKQEARCTALRGVISDLQERMYSEAIEFAEWIRIKDFQTTSKNNWIGLDMKYYTTQELFEQFKKK